jgi:hypothetical protein
MPRYSLRYLYPVTTSPSFVQVSRSTLLELSDSGSDTEKEDDGKESDDKKDGDKKKGNKKKAISKAQLDTLAEALAAMSIKARSNGTFAILSWIHHDISAPIS